MATLWSISRRSSILATGDMGANNGPNVDYANGGSMKEWGTTLDGVLKLDFDTVIPGHGPVSKRQYLIDYRDVLRRFRRP